LDDILKSYALNGRDKGYSAEFPKQRAIPFAHGVPPVSVLVGGKWIECMIPAASKGTTTGR
jgi:hypothetical protein